MITPNANNDPKNWNDRLKTADSAFVHDILQNFGLSGGLSLRDLPYVPLTGLTAMGISSKIKELKERKQEKEPDSNKSVDDFSGTMSKMRDIIDQRKPVRNHPSVPGFDPRANHSDNAETRSPYGIFDQESNGYIEGPAPDNISDVSEHPRFNSSDQGRTQRGRPFDRDEE